jgi:hypothetical protein
MINIRKMLKIKPWEAEQAHHDSLVEDAVEQDTSGFNETLQIKQETATPARTPQINGEVNASARSTRDLHKKQR